MINMMQALRKEVRADYAACVFDAKGPTFRDAIYPAARRNRAPCPTTCAQDSADPRGGAPAGLEGARCACVEADDVIGTLAVTAARQGIEVIVSSGDATWAQLVDEHITIIDTMNGAGATRPGGGRIRRAGAPDGGLPDPGGRPGG
ncbi:hypothetical protein [Candidatus Skiveiella danica]|uniref:hypothetical protein n=1 Tax=Candidatus Skiveiella danica TaxID=3386177 RepID=UPI001D1BCC21|nr:hypothetical protein [Betaproteobacteria bacterium]